MKTTYRYVAVGGQDEREAVTEDKEVGFGAVATTPPVRQNMHVFMTNLDSPENPPGYHGYHSLRHSKSEVLPLFHDFSAARLVDD